MSLPKKRLKVLGNLQPPKVLVQEVFSRQIKPDDFIGGNDYEAPEELKEFLTWQGMKLADIDHGMGLLLRVESGVPTHTDHMESVVWFIGKRHRGINGGCSEVFAGDDHFVLETSEVGTVLYLDSTKKHGLVHVKGEKLGFICFFVEPL